MSVYHNENLPLDTSLPTEQRVFPLLYEVEGRGKKNKIILK